MPWHWPISYNKQHVFAADSPNRVIFRLKMIFLIVTAKGSLGLAQTLIIALRSTAQQRDMQSSVMLFRCFCSKQ